MAIVVESPSMINNTLPEYLFIRLVIFLLQLIAPLSVALTANTAVKAILDAQWPRFSILNVWFAVETLFFLFIVFFRLYLQREAIHPPLRSRKERNKLFSMIHEQINDPKKFLQGWFRGANIEDIGRDEVKLFMDWAFWEGRADDANEKELEQYTEAVEKLIGNRFKPGKGSAQSLRLTLDPIYMDYRSVFWYMVIMLVDTITHVKLRLYGLTYHTNVATSLGVFPPRPAALLTTTRSPVSRLAYWSHPHTSKTRLPVVFLHGIGIGLYPNVEFLRDLNQGLNGGAPEDDQVGILAIEVLAVSSRLTYAILRRQDFLDQITKILDAHGYDRFVLACHSYGSVLTTNMLTHEPLVCRVAATLLIDPVTVLLHMPDVAYNFTVRPPKLASEWQLWYFASKDPGVSHTLGRHFFWTENLLWREKIVELVNKGMPLTASLASRDLIVDTQAVGNYLAECDIPDPEIKEDKKRGKHMELVSRNEKKSEEHWKHKSWTGSGLEVLWWEGLDHAQVFDTVPRREKLVEILVKYSELGPLEKR